MQSNEVSNANRIEVTIAEAFDHINWVLDARRNVALIGSPGTAKSHTCRLVAKYRNLFFIDKRLSQSSRTDFQGYPDLAADAEFAKYKPFEDIPLANAELPEGCDGWLVNLDEFNGAPKSVELAAYQLLNEREYAGKPIHEKVYFTLCGNKVTDNAIANKISTAMQTRIVWLIIKSSQKGFIKHAVANQYDFRVTSFIQFKAEAVNQFDPMHKEYTYPCERSWHILSDVIKPFKEITIKHLPLLAGSVGESMGREFFSFCQIYGKIPTLRKIYDDPTGIPIPEEPSVRHAVVGMVSHHLTPKTVDRFMQFINRFTIEFQTIAVRNALRRDRSIKVEPAMRAWCKANASRLAGEV